MYLKEMQLAERNIDATETSLLSLSQLQVITERNIHSLFQIMPLELIRKVYIYIDTEQTELLYNVLLLELTIYRRNRGIRGSSLCLVACPYPTLSPLRTYADTATTS